MPAITLQIGSDVFVHRLCWHDRIDRFQQVVRSSGNTGNERNKILHGLSRTDSAECLDDEVRITQPAIAVVPRSAGIRRFGDRGGMGGDDAAGFLEIGKLQSYSSTDDFILPVVRYRKAANPVHPVIACALQKFLACRIKFTQKRLFVAENKMHWPVEQEWCFAINVRERRVGSEPNDRLIAPIVNVVAPD